MAASVWTGYLSFGLISLPVRLYSGARAEHVSFHMLHRDDHVRVKQQLVCPAEDKVIDRSEIVKGYEYEKGEYVIVEPEEIKKIEPKTSKAMEILQFAKQDEIDPLYFESSYFLLPEEGGARPYALLATALKKSGDVGIAKLTMHNREYTAILRPYEGGLMLHTMYYENEVRRLEDFKPPKMDVKDAEVKVAQQLIEALEADFDPSEFHDTFEENVKKLVKAHLEGKEMTAVEKPRKPAPVADLMAALKQSLSQMEGGKKKSQRVTASAKEEKIHLVGKKSGGKKKKPAA